MKSLFFVVMGAMVVSIFGVYGGKVEGRIAPVVVDAEITRMEAVGETATRFWGSFEKARDCQFDSIAFYLGAEGDGPRADFVFEEAAETRAPGAENFGPWLVQLTPDQLRNRSFAIVYHRCHPLWLTETRFQ